MSRNKQKYVSSYDVKYRGLGNAMPQVNLHRAVPFANKMLPFSTATCYGAWVDQVETERTIEKIRAEILGKPRPKPRNYVIYTGTGGANTAIPLFIYDEDAQQWFECQGILYGKITTQARRRLRPEGGVILVDERVMKMILYYGYRFLAKARLERRGGHNWRAELMGFMYQGTITGRISAGNMPDDWPIKWDRAAMHIVNTRVYRK